MAQDSTQSQQISKLKKMWTSFDIWVQRWRWLLLLGIFGIMLIVTAVLGRRIVTVQKEVTEVRTEVTRVYLEVTRVQRVVIGLAATIGANPTCPPTCGPTPTDPPTPTITLSPTSVSTPTSAPSPTPTYTPLPTPTCTPLPTLTYTPLPTPTYTPFPAPTNTASPPPDTPTWTPSPTTPPPPVMLGITPAAIVRSVGGASFPVTIIGEHFAQSVDAELGAVAQVTGAVSSAAGTTITGKLPADLPVGVYGLKVINRDGSNQSGTLSPAFTVHRVPLGPTIALESPYVVTFGRDAGSPCDTLQHQVQLIFFEVPGGLGGPLYIHIFDADTGGSTSMFDADPPDDGYGTTMTYTLYGGAGAYTAPEARSATPSPTGITSGNLLLTATIGYSDTLDGRWGYDAPIPFTLGPFLASAGESVGGRQVFKLAIEGGNGNDENWYRVALSTDPHTNTVPHDARMFAFYWTGLAHQVHQSDLCLHPYLTGTTTMTLGSLGCASDGEELWVRTPFRNLMATCVGGRFTPDRFGVEDGEQGMTWTLDLSDYMPGAKAQSLLFWAENEKGSALPIFIRPTTRTPP